ncbi:NUDIX domain-containing protein [Aquiluna borgnonia]|uniref:NUDIX domain-containing protein n=1 Tax=Aquiluna borgnonia TaxID=2499157 RepID=A0A7D4UAV9_9MICO|nr:NUDIX domain-containing protein [Aquiluna borgnonia]QKJ25357.1 NUDIX domain-containing protein [Aquiluna borgnonia]
MSRVRHRRATRALIRTPENRILLFLSHFPPGSGLEPQWVFPGGGLEENETPIDGILREIYEETGLSISPGDLVDLETVIQHPIPDTREYDTGEAHFFELLVAQSFEPSSQFWTDDEHRDTVMHRWWSLEEILAEQPWIGPEGAIELLTLRLRG